MAPLKKVLLLYLVLFLFTYILACSRTYTEAHSLGGTTTTRRMLEVQNEDQPIKKKLKSSTTITDSSISTTKNKTTLIKPLKISTKNQTKLIKTTTGSSKNQTNLLKLTSESTKNKTKLLKPIKISNSTLKSQLKKLNSTFNSIKKSLDLTIPGSPKNKTTKPPTSTKQSKTQSDTNNLLELKSKNPDKKQTTEKKLNSSKTQQQEKKSSSIDQEDEDDMVTGFRDLPFKFQESLLPDLEKISTSSKTYLNKANKQITKGFKPIVGTKYAPTIASIVSFAFILLPLIVVSLLFNRIKAYFSLQKLLIFIQVYLSIYFSILCLSSLVTGLEPLRFFYATSQSTYVCLQVLQTLGYVLYLLLLLMYLVLVFSTETGPGTKMLGLGQTFVGFAVGLHYYVTVFHRVVLRQPPKTNWRVHGAYATCFLVICLLANADRRKKAYLADGVEDEKKS